MSAAGISGDVSPASRTGAGHTDATRTPWWHRVPVAILAASGLSIGLWIQAAPANFYEQFPGAGHHWVSSFGPYNEHLLRDFGAMNVALGVLALVATIRFDRTLVRATAGVWFLFGLQHLSYHLFHLDMLDGSDQIASPVALAAVLVAAVAAWFLAPPRPVDAPD
jgi:hypothetical protein